MKKVMFALGSEPNKSAEEITNKEAPAKRERKTKKVEPETVVTEAVAEVPQQPEVIPQEVVEQVAEELGAFKEEIPAEPTA